MKFCKKINTAVSGFHCLPLVAVQSRGRGLDRPSVPGLFTETIKMRNLLNKIFNSRKMETSNSKVSVSASNPDNNPQPPQDGNEVLFNKLFAYRQQWYSHHENTILGIHKEWRHRKEFSGKSFLYEQEKMALYEILKWLKANYPNVK